MVHIDFFHDFKYPGQTICWWYLFAFKYMRSFSDGKYTEQWLKKNSQICRTMENGFQSRPNKG